MKTKYKQDKDGNLILPQSEWPTLSAEDLNLRRLLDRVHQAQDILNYSTLAEREEATERWEKASREYNAEARRVVLTHK